MMNWNLKTMGKVVLALTALTLLSNIAFVEREGKAAQRRITGAGGGEDERAMEEKPNKGMNGDWKK